MSKIFNCLKRWFNRIVHQAIIDGLELHCRRYKPKPVVYMTTKPTEPEPVMTPAKPAKKIPWENQYELYLAIKWENYKTPYGAMFQDFIDHGVPKPSWE